MHAKSKWALAMTYNLAPQLLTSKLRAEFARNCVRVSDYRGWIVMSPPCNPPDQMRPSARCSGGASCFDGTVLSQILGRDYPIRSGKPGVFAEIKKVFLCAVSFVYARGVDVW